MSTVYTIPVQNIPQQFVIALVEKNYLMTVRWNDSDDAGWLIDIDDATSGSAIVGNIAMVTGADLLSGLEYLGIGGSLIVYTTGDETAVPTLDNLGVESNLYFVTNP